MDQQNQKILTPSLIFSILFLAGALFFCFYSLFTFVPLDRANSSRNLLFVILGVFIAVAVINKSKGRKPTVSPSGTRLRWKMRPQEVIPVLAVAFILIGAPAFLNAFLDKSEPMVHIALVLNKRTYKGYRVHLQSWRKEGYENISIDEQTWSQIVPGQTTLLVTTKAGWLGWEWVVGYEMKN